MRCLLVKWEFGRKVRNSTYASILIDTARENGDISSIHLGLGSSCKRWRCRRYTNSLNRLTKDLSYTDICTSLSCALTYLPNQNFAPSHPLNWSEVTSFFTLGLVPRFDRNTLPWATMISESFYHYGIVFCDRSVVHTRSLVGHCKDMCSPPKSALS